MNDLLALGTLTPAVAGFLRAVVHAGLNLLISGETGVLVQRPYSRCALFLRFSVHPWGRWRPFRWCPCQDLAVDRYRAVFFDWRGTLAHLPEPEWWVGRALESIGRPVAPQVVQAAVAGLDAAAELPEVLEAERHEDCSWELHRSVTMRRFELAGLDSELAEALYRLDLDPASHPLYPDVPEVLAALRARGVRVALVSDIHFDLRVDLAEHGIAEFVDAWVLSFEHGFQKPDPRMFTLALDAVGVQPDEALMVGDRASHDGGAAAVGIATLILPLRRELGPRGLDVVLRLVR